MSKISDIYNVIDSFSPFDTEEIWDNSGLLIGDKTTLVKNAIVSLDVTSNTIKQALSNNSNLIITHHPVIFNPLKNISASSIVYKLINNNISVISAHTNLDKSNFGINTVLARLLNLTDIEPLSISSPPPIPLGLIGTLPNEMTSDDFALYVKASLSLYNVKLINANNIIKTIAICSGGGDSLFDNVKTSSVQAFVTGDIKHHIMLDALENNITLIDAGHFGTENIIVEPLREKLSELISDVKFIISDDIDPSVII